MVSVCTDITFFMEPGQRALRDFQNPFSSVASKTVLGCCAAELGSVRVPTVRQVAVH